jgi:hypothetical protein
LQPIHLFEKFNWKRTDRRSLWMQEKLNIHKGRSEITNNYNNKLLLNSREYKIMLKPTIFENKKKGRDKLVRIINNLVKENYAVFELAKQEEKVRKTWYLDTKKKDLYYKNAFLLRIREEHDKESSNNVKGYEVTFKNRHPDRLLAASYDISNPDENPNPEFRKKEIKFEEDIITPFISKFSTSVKLDYEKLPILDKYRDLEFIFPNLDLNISPEKNLLIVNGFVADETSSTLGKLRFNDGSEASLQYSLWYRSKNKKSPVIAEFDIDINANESETSNKTLLEGFSLSLLNEVYNFYLGLQELDIDQSDDKGKKRKQSNSPKTKTQYAYDYKK